MMLLCCLSVMGFRPVHHKLKLHFADGILIASCECGNWRKEWTLLTEERPLQVLDSVEDHYEEHVEESLNNS